MAIHFRFKMMHGRPSGAIDSIAVPGKSASCRPTHGTAATAKPTSALCRCRARWATRFGETGMKAAPCTPQRRRREGHAKHEMKPGPPTPLLRRGLGMTQRGGERMKACHKRFGLHQSGRARDRLEGPAKRRLPRCRSAAHRPQIRSECRSESTRLGISPQWLSIQKRTARVFGTVRTHERFELPIRYALSGDVHIAYQRWGRTVDIILVPGVVSHVEFMHELPGYTSFLRRLATFAVLRRSTKEPRIVRPRIGRSTP